MRDLSRLKSGVILALFLLGCGSSQSETSSDPGTGPGGGGGDPGQPPEQVQLRDIVIPSLPAPYYHFEYDSTGHVRFASFASGFTMYDVIYQGGRISALQNNTLGNSDRLVYSYDPVGRVDTVRYVRPDGVESARVILSYNGGQLIGLQRLRLLSGSLTLEKDMSFSYYGDGNLEELTEHRPLVPGQQPASTTVDRFEQYDDGINVDGFGLLHQDFFDHLVLLPGVVLQKSNPGRAIRTGDGDNFTTTITYTYDNRNRPIDAAGDLVFTTGANTGQHFATRSTFTYY